MILALYIIGSAIALIVLNARLRQARQELARVREDRDACAQLLELWRLIPAAPGYLRRPEK